MESNLPVFLKKLGRKNVYISRYRNKILRIKYDLFRAALVDLFKRSGLKVPGDEKIKEYITGHQNKVAARKESGQMDGEGRDILTYLNFLPRWNIRVLYNDSIDSMFERYKQDTNFSPRPFHIYKRND